MTYKTRILAICTLLALSIAGGAFGLWLGSWTGFVVGTLGSYCLFSGLLIATGKVKMPGSPSPSKVSAK